MKILTNTDEQRGAGALKAVLSNGTTNIHLVDIRLHTAEPTWSVYSYIGFPLPEMILWGSL